MKNSLETRLGIFVALALVAALLIIEMVGGLEFIKGGYRLYAMFNNVQDLKVGSPARMAGVEVGRVEKIDLAENKVKVTMRLKRHATVRTDSVAAIKFTGLLGQNYVAIDFGSASAPRASDGAILATTEQPDFGAIMAKLDNVATGVENLTKSFTGEKIENLLGPFTDFLNANKTPLTAMIANFRSVSDQISQGKGTVGRLIYEDTLYNSALNSVTNLHDAASELKLTLDDARKIVDQINAGQGSIGKLVHDEALYRETTESMTNLKEILQKINRGQGSVGKLVNDQEFYKNAKLTLQKIEKATEGLEDQGPMSVLGMVVNSLF